MKPALFVPAIVLLALFGTSACASPDSVKASPKQPEWLDKLIARYESEPVANPPRRIIRYRYRNQFVYYVPPVCCDRPSILYDTRGKVLCAPDGGITGRGDGKCADLRRKRSDQLLIWSDKRSR